VRKHFWTADLLCTRSPVAVTLDSAGRIYVADNEYFAGALVRVDDMTGANWTSIYFGPKGTAGPNSIAVDRNGTVFAGGGIGGSVKLVDSMLGVLNSSSTLSPVLLCLRDHSNPSAESASSGHDLLTRRPELR